MSGGKPTENHMSRISSVARRALIDWVTAGLSRKGKTGAGLAKALGVNASAISRIKSGDREVNAHEIPVVAAYLGIPAPPEVTAAADAMATSETPSLPPEPEDSARTGSPRNQALDDRRLKLLAEIAIRLALGGTHQRVPRREISSWAEYAVQLFQDLQDDSDVSHQDDL